MIPIEYRPTPLWGRLLLNLLVAVFAYMLTIVLALAFAPPAIFFSFIFLTTLAIGLIFPHLRYKQSDRWLSFTFLFLTLWVVILLLITPTFTKQYYLGVASDIIPTHSIAKLVEVKYLSGQGNGISVNYRYETNAQAEDYQKMVELYKNIFINKGYKTDREEVGSQIYFQKKNSSSPTIFLGISSKSPDSIEVSMHPGEARCFSILFFGDIESFILCQKNWVG